VSTLSQLRTAIAYELGLDNTASSADQTQVDRWANEAVERVLIDTRCRVAKSTAALTIDEDDYELATGIMLIHRLIDADNRPLFQVGPEEIYELRRASTTSQASVERKYAVDGANMLLLWPPPTTAETLTVYYVPRPTAMSATTHDPSTSTYGGVPSEFHYAIELWACARGASADDDESSAQGQRYRDQYMEELRRIRRAQNLKGARRLPRATLAVDGRRRIPHDPSIDWSR